MGPQRFSRKVAFITGGATGMGRSFAAALCDEGAQVVIADIDTETATRTADEIGESAVAVACDVADRSSVDRAVGETLEQCGGIDILVNNAARHMKKYSRPFSTLTCGRDRGSLRRERVGRRQLLRWPAAHRCASAAGARSSTWHRPPPSPWARRTGSRKLAVRGLTITFAKELGGDNIRVNAIAPGMVSTENALTEYTAEELAAIRTAQVLKDPITMDDITRVALFLCSEESALVTGETIRVTGGGWLSI